ncbi:hypothetical protein [Hymenobacter yonginensis]|uniref:DUF4168 domain-containing protein n=1 Tax=Hymenobacter yonginensis TaxID=748197 RepID=A0ABY7PTG8_9BACT|nr:hypothetical protein [Hymenobacter yonginensis]WBO86233.1 hypothetical protein O9Z63_08220 [Hymenobacter yonginensis]
MKFPPFIKQLALTASLAQIGVTSALVVPVLLPTTAVAQNQASQAASISNRLEQLVGGLFNGQRDAVRQYAETLVRDRGQNRQAAIQQFENALKPTLSPIQFEQYMAYREYVMTGKGARPAATKGPRTQAEAAGAIATRIEKGLGGLFNGQRDAVRQYAETLVRDREQNQEAAIQQFENALKPVLSPIQFEKYQANRDFYLTGRGQKGK